MNTFKPTRIFIMAALASAGLIISSCTKDEPGTPTPTTTAAFTASDQSISGNTVMVSSVTLDAPGWVVIHADNGSGGPQVPAIISEPKFLEAGTSTDVKVNLLPSASLSDGSTIWVMLHNDSGAAKKYEFDGKNGLDLPLKDTNGNVLTSAITATSVSATGSFTAADQDITANTVVASSITLNKPGWIVVHEDDGNGGPVVPAIISEPKFLDAGTSTDVAITLLPSANIKDGASIWLMLHNDSGEAKKYEFDGKNGLDLPIKDASGNVVTSPITIKTNAATGTFTAEDQTLTQNTLVVSSATFNKSGWIVVHKDNGSGGPVVPAIISVPKQVSAGTSTDIVVQLEPNTAFAAGEKLWIMLHTDTGIAGTYEFDGQNGLDLPIKDASGDVVTSTITISAAAVTAVDQAVTNNQVTIAEVKAAEDGWIVIHNDNGTGGIGLPIGNAAVTAGVNTDIVIDLEPNITYKAGQKLFAMLHIDQDPKGEYNFPGVDIPEVFGTGNVIVKSFTVK